MSVELGQIAAPIAAVFGALATAILSRIPNGISTKADRREDYKSADEFLQKLTDDTPAFVVEKWYEAISGGDKAEDAEVRLMLRMRGSAKVFGLRRNGKNYLDLVKDGTGRAVGYTYRGLWKYSLVRVGYDIGNLISYVALFGFPVLPLILGKHDLLTQGMGVAGSYVLTSVSTFCMAITRIKALGYMSCARQLVARSQEKPDPAPSPAVVEDARLDKGEDKPEPVPAMPAAQHDRTIARPPNSILLSSRCRGGSAQRNRILRCAPSWGIG
jgi:hypothetical protein